MATRKFRKLSKKQFCNLAKKRGSKRDKFLKMVHKKTHNSHKTRVKHIKRYCKTHKTRSDKAFCKKALKFSRKRYKNDLRFTRVGLKRNSKVKRKLLKYCKKH